MRDVTERERPPRAVFLKFPFGHPIGQKGDIVGQRRVILEALRSLVEIKTPGEIVDLGFLWRRTDFTALPPIELEGLYQVDILPALKGEDS
jgi:hypothetical protein